MGRSTRNISNTKAMPSGKAGFPFGISRRVAGRIFMGLKLAVSGLTLWYLYTHILLADDFLRSLQLLKTSLSSPSAYFLLAGSLALIFINWGMEALKWQVLVEKFYKLNFITAFKAILAGTAISLWVPNRTGEYMGRVLYVPQGSRVKGILATLAGSAAQLIISLVLGCLGLLYYLWFNLKNYYLFIAVMLLAATLCILLFFLYFHIQKIKKFIPNSKWIKPLRKYAGIYREYSFADLLKVMHFSFLRYMVFCTQFVLLAYMFGAKIPLVESFFTLFLLYLIQTAVPTTFLTELGLRGITTVYFFEAYTTNKAGILAASYTLWFINLALPAIIGLVFLLAAKMDNKKRAV